MLGALVIASVLRFLDCPEALFYLFAVHAVFASRVRR
jgi:hypothetical protein